MEEGNINAESKVTLANSRSILYNDNVYLKQSTDKFGNEGVMITVEDSVTL